jgi:hypothetical protein
MASLPAAVTANEFAHPFQDNPFALGPAWL